MTLSPSESPSELILNQDGSIYHLNLKPGDIAPIVITVGDPERVGQITRHFDTIRLTKQKREFKTQTGRFRESEITVISTGIGTDNIDIVLNELDALVNVDFKTREIKPERVALKIIRVGTSGALQKNIPLDSYVISERAVGFDNLMQFYKSEVIRQADLEMHLKKHMGWGPERSTPYAVKADDALLSHFKSDRTIAGVTATNCGFYGPQGRKIRLLPADKNFNKKLEQFTYQGFKITNLEMETSGIYGLAKLLGHQAISLNAILANRALGTFSNRPQKTIDDLITYTLSRIISL